MPFGTKRPAEVCAAYKKAARTARSAMKGDWVEFRFEEPVKCNYIKIANGYEHMQAAIIHDGHIEVCYDGESFVDAGALHDGYLELLPKNKSIHALRIVADGDSGIDGMVEIQPLIIK